jgi:hypothetical protein
MDYVMTDQEDYERVEKFKSKLPEVQRLTINDKCLSIAFRIINSRNDIDEACRESAKYCIDNNVFTSKIIHVDNLYNDLLRYCHIIKKTE